MDKKDVNYYLCHLNIDKEVTAFNRVDGVCLSVFDFGSRNLNASDMVILCAEDVDTSVEYICLFTNGWEISDESEHAFIGGRDLLDLTCSSKSTMEYYMQKCEQVISPLFVNTAVKVALCASSYNYCILLPQDYSSIVDLVSDTLESLRSHFTGKRFVENRPYKLTERILSRSQIQHAYRSNPSYREHLAVIQELLNAPVSSDDEALEYTLIASLQLHAMLIETRRRWSNDYGELHYEDSATANFLEKISYMKRRDLRQFIEQSSPQSRWHDLIWSLMFISRGLLASIMERDPKLISVARRNAHHYLEERNDFFGFMPLVSQRVDSISSYYHDHISPSYNYGFLTIPCRYSNTLWAFFPAYIHEFFHYVAPSNRTERNHVVLRLAVHAVLNPLCTYLCSPKSRDYERYNNIHHGICEHASAISDILEPYQRENRNNIDSMYYLIKMQCLNVCDFRKIYDLVVTPQLPTTSELAQIQEKCCKLWKDDIASYLRTFTIALREIRSDISMLYFLWRGVDSDMEHGLKRYITILAAEPGFAKTSARSTADSAILRFGFVTRYMVYQIYNGSIHGEELLIKWREKVNGIIEVLLSSVISEICDFASKDELGQITIQKLDHLFDYADEYEKMVISKKDGYYTEKWHSLFENLIYPQMSGKSHESEGLVGSWEHDIIEIVMHNFPQKLSEIYQVYEKSAIKGDYKKVFDIEYNSRMIFRKLFTYFPKIDL